jgi:hypothetical protein
MVLSWKDQRHKISWHNPFYLDILSSDLFWTRILMLAKYFPFYKCTKGTFRKNTEKTVANYQNTYNKHGS